MGVRVLALEGKFHDRLSRAIHLEQARVGAGLGEHDVPVGQRLRGVHLGLCAFVFKHDLVVASHFDNRAAGIIFVFGDGHEHISIGQDKAVAGLRGIFPQDLAIAGEDRGFAAGDEHGMGDLRGLGVGGEGGGCDGAQEENGGGAHENKGCHMAPRLSLSYCRIKLRFCVTGDERWPAAFYEGMMSCQRTTRALDCVSRRAMRLMFSFATRRPP